MIELQSVSKEFEVRGRLLQALGKIDLSVERKVFVALVGPSGCGKSTILNMVAGLMPPSSGQVLYNGEPVTGPNRRVGYMTQKDTLLPWRTVAENVGTALELKCRATPAAERRERVARIIDTVGLHGFGAHYPGELSGGMRKRAALARMLIYEPETLLLDEPFGALDAQLKLVMQEELMRLADLWKTTVLFVTHDLVEAITLADIVVVFTGRPGRIRAVREIDLPRPRDVQQVRFTPRFAALYENLWDELKDEVRKEVAA